jgi:hypothetical protein
VPVLLQKVGGEIGAGAGGRRFLPRAPVGAAPSTHRH